MNRIMQRRGSRTIAAMALTCVLVLIALSMLSLTPSGLVRTARADGAAAEARKDHDNNYILAQVARLHDLHAALHETGSGNGDPATRTQHLAELGGLWANDATLTIAATGQVIKGRAAIVDFFAATPQFNNDWLSLTVAFRTAFDVDRDGDSANIYLECHWVDPATGIFKVERSLTGTASKIHGIWVLQDVTAAAVSL
jgi:hypothetical protein